MVLPNTSPTVDGVTVYPAVGGATNWFSPSYSPSDHLFFVNVSEMGHIYHKGEAIYQPGTLYNAGGARTIPGEEPFAEVRAFEPETGTLKWAFPTNQPPRAGILSTGGGLVFASAADGAFFALDSSTGKPLWHFQTGGAMYSNPISYAVDGKQQVAIAAGHAIYVFGLGD
jgi:alcohol dehydrogenase (cytochrome c)